MAEPKTRLTGASMPAFLVAIADVDPGVLETLCERAHATLGGGFGAGRRGKRAQRAR